MNQNCQRGGAYAIARKFPVNHLKTFTKKANGFENLNVRYLAFLEGDPSQRPHSHRGHKVTLMGWHRMFSRCSHLLPASLRTSARSPSSKFVQTHSNSGCWYPRAPVLSSRNISHARTRALIPRSKFYGSSISLPWQVRILALKLIFKTFRS